MRFAPSFTVSLLATTLALLAPTVGLAQPPQPPTAQIEAVAALGMVGDWAGTGWIEMGPRGRFEFEQTENVELRAGDTVLLVEGRGTSTIEGRKVPIHDALGVISFDPATKKYRFLAFTGRGQHEDTELTRAGDNLVWFIAGPQGRIRFTITLTANSWREVGEVEREGGWRPFMEMNLKRVGE